MSTSVPYRKRLVIFEKESTTINLLLELAGVIQLLPHVVLNERSFNLPFGVSEIAAVLLSTDTPFSDPVAQLARFNNPGTPVAGWEIPVVLMTANRDSRSYETYAALPHTAVIAKPLRHSELFPVLQEHLMSNWLQGGDNWSAKMTRYDELGKSFQSWFADFQTLLNHFNR